MNIINKILWRMNLRLLKIFPKPSIKFMKDHFNDMEVIGAEVGVGAGHNALSIYKQLNIKKLYLIDPYETYGDADYGDYYQSQGELSNAEIVAEDKLKNYPEVVFIKELSDTALKEIDTRLNFVYLDSNKNYEFVKRDLINYYNKLTLGGVLAGDNFCSVVGMDTVRAVVDFVKECNLNLQSSGRDWWIVKK